MFFKVLIRVPKDHVKELREEHGIRHVEGVVKEELESKLKDSKLEVLGIKGIDIRF